MRKVILISMAGALLVGFAASAAQADIVSNLAAYWKLDETVAGPVVNQVGTDGTNYGATIGQPGQIGTAYSFLRSSEQYVDTNLNNIIPATGDFSLFAWINTTSHTGLDTDYAGYIFSNYRATDDGRTALQVANGNLSFFVSSQNMAASAVNDGEWHHVGVTRDSSGFRLWVDGTPTSYGMTSGVEDINDGAQDWRIATHVSPPGTGTRYFNGLIDDVRVYHRALTAGDVAQLMAVPEPSSFVLLAMGLLAASWRRRRG